MDVQELLYSSATNPLPNIVDQGLANEVSGNVTVWISDKEDWESLKKVIRVRVPAFKSTLVFTIANCKVLYITRYLLYWKPRKQ